MLGRLFSSALGYRNPKLNFAWDFLFLWDNTSLAGGTGMLRAKFGEKRPVTGPTKHRERIECR